MLNAYLVRKRQLINILHRNIRGCNPQKSGASSRSISHSIYFFIKCRNSDGDHQPDVTIVAIVVLEKVNPDRIKNQECIEQTLPPHP